MPSKSPCFQRKDKLDITDITNPTSVFGSQRNRQQISRSIMDVSDIDIGKSKKHLQVIDKNESLMTDDIIGRKKKYFLQQQSNPLDPQYILSTQSHRKMVIGQIEDNKPRKIIKETVNKDSKRYMRADDIVGAQPKDHFNIPQEKLPEIHPNFVNKEEQNIKLIMKREEYKKRNRESTHISDLIQTSDQASERFKQNQLLQPASLTPYQKFQQNYLQQLAEIQAKANKDNETQQQKDHLENIQTQNIQPGFFVKHKYSLKQTRTNIQELQNEIKDANLYNQSQFESPQVGVGQKFQELSNQDLSLNDNLRLSVEKLKSQRKIHLRDQVKSQRRTYEQSINQPDDYIYQKEFQKRLESNRFTKLDIRKQMYQEQNQGNLSGSNLKNDIQTFEQRSKSQVRGQISSSSSLTYQERLLNRLFKSKYQNGGPQDQISQSYGININQIIQSNRNQVEQNQPLRTQNSSKQISINYSQNESNINNNKIQTNNSPLVRSQNPSLDQIGRNASKQQISSYPIASIQQPQLKTTEANLQFQKVVPPLAEGSKYGGPQYAPSNRSYGNFIEGSQIDELLKNVRELRQQSTNIF